MVGIMISTSRLDGYEINLASIFTLHAFDVVIHVQCDSPVLWIRGSSGTVRHQAAKRTAAGW